MKPFITFITIIIFLLFALPIHSQQENPTTSAGLVYQELMGELGKGNMKAVDSLALHMYAVAEADKDTNNMANALSTTSMLAMYAGDFEKADSIMKESLPLYFAVKNFDTVVSCYGELSGMERKKGNIDLALMYVRKGQALLHKTKKNQTKVFNSNIIALAFRAQGQMDSTIHYELDVIDKLPLTDSTSLTQAYSNLSSSFLTVGNSAKRKQYLDLALKYSKDNTGTKGEVLYKLSDYEINRNNLDSAYQYAQQSLASYKASSRKSTLKDGYLGMVKVYLAKNEKEKAIRYLDTVSSLIKGEKKVFNVEYLLASLQLSATTSHSLPQDISISQIIDAVHENDHVSNKVKLYSLLNKYYRKTKDYKKAEKYLSESVKYKSIQSNAQNIEVVNNLEEKYKTKQKEMQISNLELQNSKQKQRLIGGGIVLCLISLLSFFLLRLYQKVTTQKKFITKALSEKDLLLREIHHRVKNNLQLVSSLLTLQGRSIDDKTALQAINEGKSRVRSMALIHQDLYNKENLTEIGVKNYIEKLTQELFSTYRIDSDEIILQMEVQDIDMDVDTLVPLGLIINELITNSLKYAFPKKSNGTLLLHLSKSSGMLVLKVIDNGIGYDHSKTRDNSFGTTLINALTEQLEGTMKISNNGGTHVEISMPAL